MIKSQFIIMGILSLIAVVGTTSTISQANAELKASDILGLADQTSSGIDVGKIADQAKPDFGALKSFADKFSSVPSTTDLLSSLGNPTSTPPSTAQ